MPPRYSTCGALTSEHEELEQAAPESLNAAARDLEFHWPTVPLQIQSHQRNSQPSPRLVPVELCRTQNFGRAALLLNRTPEAVERRAKGPRLCGLSQKSQGFNDWWLWMLFETKWLSDGQRLQMLKGFILRDMWDQENVVYLFGMSRKCLEGSEKKQFRTCR